MRPSNVLTFILAGGTGTRLRPLTLRRCKPVVPFGGNFRVIDFTLMNCVSSGLGDIYVLLQYQPEALVRHLNSRWGFLSGVGTWGPTSLKTLSPKTRDGYLGTADAVYKNLEILELRRPTVVLILSGDHIYHADYQKLIAFHVESNADVTVLRGEVPVGEASSFGVLDLELSSGGRVHHFVEKPADPHLYAHSGRCSINLGVYCFRPRFLVEQLVTDAQDKSSSHDFGKDIFPLSSALGLTLSCPLEAISPCRKAYWRDVGTLGAFFEANMDLVRSPVAFYLMNPQWPLAAPFRSWLPARFQVCEKLGNDSIRSHNLFAKHVETKSSRIKSCVISSGVRLGKNSELSECVLFPGAQIGKGARLRRVIVEEGVRVPSGIEIGFEPSEVRVNGQPQAVTVLSDNALGTESRSCEWMASG
jgi:glucose-1-phosphate adenylyltransferase